MWPDLSFPSLLRLLYLLLQVPSLADNRVQRCAWAHYIGNFRRVAVVVATQICRCALNGGQFYQNGLLFITQRFCR